MKKYKVSGTIKLNFEITVEANNEHEAEQLGAEYAEDGHGLSTPVSSAEVGDVEPVGIL